MNLNDQLIPLVLGGRAASRPTAAETFALIDPLLVPPLATPANLAEMHVIARRATAPSQPEFVFECSLDDEEVHSDFSLTVAPGSDEGAPLMQPIASLMRTAQSPESPIPHYLQKAWLEYDLARDGKPGSLAPSVFVELRSPGGRDSPGDPGELAEVLIETVSALHPEAMSLALRAQLDQCCQALPAGATLLGVGAMLGRTPPTTRFCAQGLGPTHLAAYLAEIGWPGEASVVGRTLSAQRPYCDSYRLAVDLGEQIGPRLGVECVPIPLEGEPSSATWGPLLDHLVAGRLCTESRRDLVLGWTGETVRADTLQVAPDRLIRQVSHIKLSFYPDRPPGAKAYLHATYISGSSLAGMYLHLRAKASDETIS